MRVQPFTLHIRMTKECNADCSYCSSFETVSTGRMTPEQFEKATSYIFGTALPRLGVSPTHMTAQYIGGEILTYPARDLADCVAYLRGLAQANGVDFRDGCQSNLIGSPAKVDRMYRLFQGRVGTSVDSYGSSRTVQGSADKYRLIWRESDDFLLRKRSPAGAVFVLDKDGINNAQVQVMEALRDSRALTLRPVFQGGTPGQVLLGAEETKKVFVTTFEQWFMRMPIIIEPFFGMTHQRVLSRLGRPGSIDTACAFQSDCSKKSLSLEPNGDLFVCQEMADAGIYRIGNALTGEWDEDVVRALDGRTEHLHEDCITCPYVAECRGGCMFESVQQGRGLYGKSHHCISWKSIYKQIDDGVDLYGAEAVMAWLNRIAARQANALSDGLAQAEIDDLENQQHA